MVKIKCSKCDIEKDETYFYKRNSKLGFRLDCKECNREWRRKWRRNYYIKNKIKEIELAKLYRQTLKGRMIQTNKNHWRRLKLIKTDITSEWLIKLSTKSVFCPICKKRMDTNGKEKYGKQLDHIIPLNIGGEHKKYNIRYICRKCNQSRPKDGSDIVQIKLAI